MVLLKLFWTIHRSKALFSALYLNLFVKTTSISKKGSSFNLTHYSTPPYSVIFDISQGSKRIFKDIKEQHISLS